MTVGELIEELKKFDANDRVIVDAFAKGKIETIGVDGWAPGWSKRASVMILTGNSDSD